MHSGDEQVRTLAGIKPLDEAGLATLAKLPRFISTDSHLQEPDEVWQQLPPRLLATYRDEMTFVTFKGEMPPGASDPHARLLDQDTDGIEAEVVFPNNGMAAFGFDDVETQVATFQLYNDFLADFCKTAPNVGSSRVDLQACKLEYSIVSPK